MSAGQIEPAYAAAMPAPQGGALPTPLEWQGLERMADTLASSTLVPYRLRGKPGDIAVILLAAREYGIPAVMALAKLPVVNGTPAPMGELMVALVLRAGHYIAADFRNPDGSVYKGGPVTAQHYGECRYKRREWDAQETITFTLDEALTAGLIDRISQDGKAIARVIKTKNGSQVEEVTPWEQYTPNMARWRSVANACRLAFADVLMGLSYLPEELGATVDEDGAPIMGEVVDARRAPTGSLEQRTAQEAADKLAEQPWPPHVTDAVRTTATEGGFVDMTVTYKGESMTLAEALDSAAAEYAAMPQGETVSPPTGDEQVLAFSTEVVRPAWDNLEALSAALEELTARGMFDAPVTTTDQQQTTLGELVRGRVAQLSDADAVTPGPQETRQEPQEPVEDAPQGAPEGVDPVQHVLEVLDAAQSAADMRRAWALSGHLGVRDVEVTYPQHGTLRLGTLIHRIGRTFPDADERTADHAERAAGDTAPVG